MSLLKGFHHLTAGVAGAQEDVDFFTRVVGQRMVKQTVLMDGGRGVYHLYYADEVGTPGTVMTSFPYRKLGVNARPGSGQARVLAYSVPSGSMDFWKDHLDRHGVERTEVHERFGQPYIRFSHPCGIGFEVVGDDNDARHPWVTSEIPEEAAVRGLHNVTLSLREVYESEIFMQDAFGFRKLGDEGAYSRFELGGGGASRTVDLLHEPDRPAGSWILGAGVVHHIAFAISSEEEQQQFKDHVVGLGYTDMSESKDRYYFRSMYVRMPGGVLFEVTTDGPGFLIDEDSEVLGRSCISRPGSRDAGRTSWKI